MNNQLKTITGIGYDGKRWILIDEVSLRSVRYGDIRDSFRGEPATVKGGTPPHKPGSTGRIQTTKGEHYPGVFLAKWERF